MENKRSTVMNFFIVSFNGMAIGLFSTLIIGVILTQLSKLIGYIPGFDFLSNSLLVLANTLKPFMGIGIGFGVAISLKLEGIKLVVAGIAGGIATSQFNDPMVAYLAAISVYFALKYVLFKKTPVDILLVPLLGVITAFAVTSIIGHPVTIAMNAIGDFIKWATELQPFVMGVVISVLMGMALTAPISSAAIAFAITLGGIAGGAATVGCCVQMLGFAIMSRKDNNIGSVISIAIGTSMLQFKNIIKKPIIWLPTIIVSAILGPFSTLVFKMQTTYEGSGMGTSGLVGQFATLEAMNNSLNAYIAIIVLQIVLPVVLVWLVDVLFRKFNLIKEGDLKL
ncbi:MAG: PTS sugar transporter subunit IIC [Erysipelotrichaceae bacterium]|jgi:uncharacterized membrane protein|nr:PTS sugar transporter subunit IIC [Erysipelotrichaceae bacterium]